MEIHLQSSKQKFVWQLSETLLIKRHVNAVSGSRNGCRVADVVVKSRISGQTMIVRGADSRETSSRATGSQRQLNSDGEDDAYQKFCFNFTLEFRFYDPVCLSVHVERFHSRDQHTYKFTGTKESVYIRKEFNSHRIGLHGTQHDHCFIVLEHQYGCMP